MAEDNNNVLGIQATINASEIEKGANDFVKKLNEMENAASKTSTAISNMMNQLDNKSALKQAKEELKGINKSLKEQQKMYNEAWEQVDKYTRSLNNLKAAKEGGAMRVSQGEKSVLIDSAIADAEEALRGYTEQLNKAGSELAALDEQTEAYKGVIEDLTKKDEPIFVKMLGGAENYKEIMDALPGSVKHFVKDLEGMTKAANVFIKTPLGIVLGALLLAFKAVQSYLTSTAEGQMKLAKATGFLTGLLKPFKQLIVSIGEELVNAFTNPKEAVIGLWDTIKSQIVNRVVGIIELVQSLSMAIGSAFAFDKEGFAQALKEAGDAVLKITSGVDDAGTKMQQAGKKIIQFGGDVVDAGKKNANIAVEKRNLEIQMKEWEKTKQKLEAKKQQARGIVSNTSLSTKERRDAEKEYEKILDDEYKMEMAFINKKIDLQKREMALAPKGGSQEQKDALTELEAEREKIIADYQRGLAERQDTNGTLINAEREALKELGNMQAELELDNQNRRLSIMKEGHAKRIEELTMERDAELHKLEETKQKFQKQNRSAGVEGVGEDGLTEAQRNALAKSAASVETVYQHGVKKSLEEELSDILTYQQAREKIEKEYAEKRKNLYELDESGNIKYNDDMMPIYKSGVNEGNATQLNQNQSDALAAIDEEFASKSQVYLGWVESISDMTIKQLNKTLEDAETELATLETQGDNADPQSMAIARAKIKELQDKIKQLEGQGDKGNQRSIDTWKELGSVLSETAKEFESLGDAIGGTAGEIISSLGSTFSSTVGLMNNITQFVDICQQGIKNTSGTAISAIKAVEAGTVILTIISAAVQVIQKIVNIANKMHDAKHDKVIEGNQEKIDKLKDSYEELEEAVSNSYGSTAVQGLKDMNASLEKQNRLIQEQKEEEEAKKGDADTTQYDDAMEANRKQMEENKKAMEEAIFGEDIQSAIENFAEAYADAIAEGKNLEASFKDYAVNMVKEMVKQKIKEQIAGDKKLEALRKKAEIYMADDKISTEELEALKAEAIAIGKDLDEKFAWAEEILAAEDSTSTESSKRGIATASQESVDENNGRLMSIQLSMAEITTLQRLTQADLSMIRSDMATQNKYISEIVDIQYESVGYLSSIDKNTRQLYEMNERLGKIEANTRNL